MQLIATEFLERAILADAVDPTTGHLRDIFCYFISKNFSPLREYPNDFFNFDTGGDFVGGLHSFAEVFHWNAPSRADDGSIEMVGYNDEFRGPSAGFEDSEVYGILFQQNTSPFEYVASARFDDAPISVADALDSILITIRFRLNLSGVAEVIS